MKRSSKDKDIWEPIDVPGPLAEFMHECDRLVVFGIGHKVDAENAHVGLFSYGLRVSDYADLMVPMAEFQKRYAHNAIVCAANTLEVLDHLNQRMLTNAAAVEKAVVDAAAVLDDPDLEPTPELVVRLVGLLGQTVGSLNSLNLLAWDKFDPLAGVKTKEPADVQTIADDIDVRIADAPVDVASPGTDGGSTGQADRVEGAGSSDRPSTDV